MAGGLCGVELLVVAPCGCSLWGIFVCSSVQSEEFSCLVKRGGGVGQIARETHEVRDFTLNEKSVVGCSLCYRLLGGDKRFFLRNGWLTSSRLVES
jgi:hypothetical protein